MAERLTTEQGRQGERRPMAMKALVIGTGLMLVALAALMVWNFKDAPKSYPGDVDAAARQSVTGSAPGAGGASSANAGGVPGGNPSYPAPSVKNANQ